MKILCILYDDPKSGMPSSYARDDLPKIEKYPGTFRFLANHLLRMMMAFHFLDHHIKYIISSFFVSCLYFLML